MTVAAQLLIGNPVSVEQTNQVDFIGIDNETGNVVLTISDHLDWTDRQREHMLMLQEKLNSYLRFVESGEILESYPSAGGRSVEIRIAAKYALSADAEHFLVRCKSIIESAGLSLKHELL